MENKGPKYMNHTTVGLIMLILGTSIGINQFKVTLDMAEIAANAGIAPENCAWLMSIFTIISIFLALPAGILAGKHGPKTVAIWAGLFVAAGAIIGAFGGRSGAVLLFSRAIEGVGFSLIGVVGPATVASHVAPDKISSAIGIWACWVPAGNVFAVNIIPRIYAGIKPNITPIWLGCAALSILAVLLVKFCLKSPEGVEAPAAAEAPKQGTLGDAFKKKNLILASIGFMMFNILLMIVLNFVATPAANAGIPAGLISIVASMPMFGCFFSSPIIGAMAGKAGKHKGWFVISLAATGIGAVLCFMNSAPMIWLGVILIGFIGLANPGMILASVDELVDGDASLGGYGNGIVITFQNIGQFLATFLFPIILSTCGGSYATAGLVTLVFTAIGVAATLAAKWK